ncbi:glycosyltransferase family 39 protein [bacterium]|nr:glycosyltransferase family 39 protein [bacterium]MBU1982844.1 glycosyltransferase family 39 protein [bacterium]
MKDSRAIPRLVAWLIIILGMLACRAGFLEDVIYNIDEAEYAVAADALDHGWLPGVDLLGSTKPPGIAVLFNLLFHIFGRSMAVIHVAHVILMIGAGILLVELAIALWSATAAVPAALLFWMVLNSFNLPHEIIALNVESPGILLILGAFLLVWAPSRSRWRILLGGILAGAAILFRQSLGAFLLPLIFLVGKDSNRPLRGIVVLLAGVCLPWLPVFVVYAQAGALAWTWDSWVRYPITYSSDTGILGFLDALYLNLTDFATQATIPLAAAIGGGIVVWRSPKDRGRSFLFWMTLASVLALFSGSRFFGHYWIQIYPVLALLGVPAWFTLWRGTRIYRLLLVGAIAIGGLVATLHFPTWRLWDHYAPPRGVAFFHLGKESLEIKTAEFVRANTEPDETIVVWGYCPQIYYHADRLPGVRDYLCQYITGYSPGSFDPFSQRAPRSCGHIRAEEMFVEDLERRRPKYVFDLVQVYDYTFPFIKYSIRSYPMLADYMRRRYLPEGRIGDVLVYRRRTPADTWWPSQEDVK